MNKIIDNDLVNIDDYGIKGSNYYYENAKNIGILENEFEGLQITKHVLLKKSIIPIIQKINIELKLKGFELFIKEGFRSSTTYNRIYELRCLKRGKEHTDRLLNMEDKPHASGTSIDVTLFNIIDNKLENLHKKEDGIEGFKRNFYDENQLISENIKIIKLRSILEAVMYKNGFRNFDNEYFHFNFIKKDINNGT